MNKNLIPLDVFFKDLTTYLEGLLFRRGLCQWAVFLEHLLVIVSVFWVPCN